MSGAEFQREVGPDPFKWAQRFLAAAEAGDAFSAAERLAFTAAWFRDAMDAAVKARGPDLTEVTDG